MIELANRKQISTWFNFSYYSDFYKHSEAESKIIPSQNIESRDIIKSAVTSWTFPV